MKTRNCFLLSQGRRTSSPHTTKLRVEGGWLNALERADSWQGPNSNDSIAPRSARPLESMSSELGIPQQKRPCRTQYEAEDQNRQQSNFSACRQNCIEQCLLQISNKLCLPSSPLSTVFFPPNSSTSPPLSLLNPAQAPQISKQKRRSPDHTPAPR